MYQVTRKPFNFESRTIPYDPRFRAPRVLRTLAGLGAIVRGMGAFDPSTFNPATGTDANGTIPTQTDLQMFGLPGGATCPAGQHFAAGACVTDCNQSDPGAQYACVTGNLNAWNQAYIQQQQSAPPAPTRLPPVAPPAPAYHPQLSFTTSRGGTTVYPGDTWAVKITGAQPNQPVSVLGTHPDGGKATANFGSTDGSGNFTLTGTITPDMVGNWSEVWSVGSSQVGSFSFVVVATAPASGSTGTTSSTTGGGSSATNPTAAASSFSLSDIPWWGWAIAGVGGIFLLGGGHGR